MDCRYLLVSDDHAGIRHLLFEVLSDEGYKVEMASSGTETLQKVRMKTPDLILLDWKMPEASGMDLYMELRRIAPSVPVIVITAYTELFEVSKAKNVGLIQYHMSKPFDLDKLRNLIKVILTETMNLKQA
jgi:two-component system response regulator (stage 0 sporulation protein F)